ncbi:MAG: JAB domain-containing protein [Betaproteobacteria bacterium]
MTTLYRVTVEGTYVEVSGEDIVKAAKAVMNRRVKRGTALTSPRLVRDYLSMQLGSLEHETFCVALLDTRHRLIEFVELFRGTIDGASVHRGRRPGAAKTGGLSAAPQ